MNPAASPTVAQPSPQTFRAGVGQRGKGVDIALDDLRAARKSPAPTGCDEKMRPEPFAEIRSVGQFKNARVVNDPGADIAAAERNDPAPPAVAHQVVRRPVAARAAGVRVVAKFFAPLVAVPVFHAGEARPDGVDRVLGVLAEMAQLSGEHARRGRSRRPASGGYARLRPYRSHRTHGPYRRPAPRLVTFAGRRSSQPASTASSSMCWSRVLRSTWNVGSRA